MKHHICFVSPEGAVTELSADSLDRESRVVARVKILQTMDKGGFVISHKDKDKAQWLARVASDWSD